MARFHTVDTITALQALSADLGPQVFDSPDRFRAALGDHLAKLDLERNTLRRLAESGIVARLAASRTASAAEQAIVVARAEQALRDEHGLSREMALCATWALSRVLGVALPRSPQGFEVAGAHARRVRDSSGDAWWPYVVLFENPNPDVALWSVPLWIDALDAADSVLASDPGSLKLPPGRSAVTGSLDEGFHQDLAGKDIDSLTVRGSTAFLPVEEPGVVSFSDVRLTRSGSFSRVTGTVSSSFTTEQKPGIVIVAFDDEDDIIAFTECDPGKVPAGGSLRFEADFDNYGGPLPDGSYVTAYREA